MTGRHRHAVNVRTDGLAAVLGPLASDPRVRAAALVDVDSGMVLDSCGRATADQDVLDAEARGAAHAELVRTVLALAPGTDDCEIVVHAADGSRHVLHQVADPHGDRLALAVVVDGSSWVLTRLRRRLRAVSAAALTAGPSMALRPTADGWEPNRLLAPVPVAPPVVPPTGGTHPPEHEPLWLPADHTADPQASTSPTVPALAGIPEQPAAPPPRQGPGSAWTAPPAPSTPDDVDRAGAADEQTPADEQVPGPRRPAPPSALPPGLSWAPSAGAEEGLGRPTVEPA